MHFIYNALYILANLKVLQVKKHDNIKTARQTTNSKGPNLAKN